jgi:SAM-dependent methyltransferase
LKLPPGQYDVVVMLELLEHVERPASYLAEAHRLLRPGGGLLLSMPDYDSLTRRLIGAEWRIFSPEHLHYFTRQSLMSALRATGFSHVTISCVNWNPFDVLFSRRLAPMRRWFGREGGRGTGADARVAEQQLRQRIYAHGSSRWAKGVINRLLSSAGIGDTLWAYAEAESEVTMRS